MDDRQQREVARGLRAGKSEAWLALYEAYAEPIWHVVARRMGPGSAEVADVVQEVFLAAARSAGTYDAARGSLWLWLGGIARKQVALHYRRQRRHDRLPSNDHPAEPWGAPIARWLDGGENLPAEALASAELAELVRRVLDKLPAEYETLLVARYLDGVSVEELAGLGRCSATAVRSKLARARGAFRRAFCRASSSTGPGLADRQAARRRVVEENE